MDTKLQILCQFSRVGVMVLKNGKVEKYGSIRTENDHLVHWTNKGLREVFPLNPDRKQKKNAELLKKRSEEELVSSQHISIIPLSEIETIIR